MALAAGDPAYMWALGGVGRGGAIRAGVVPTHTYVSVVGTDRTSSVRRQDSLSIRQDRSGQSIATIRFNNDFTPSLWQEVIIRRGSTTSYTRHFAGRIIRIEQTYEADDRQLVIWDVSVADYRVELAQWLVTEAFTATDPADILRSLVSTYAPAFSTTHVPASLGPALDIVFTRVPLDDAISRLIDTRAGGHWWVDYHRRIEAVVPVGIVLADGPTLWLEHEEVSGATAHDSSGNNHDATISGSPSLGVAGILGLSFYSDVNGAVWSIPHHADLIYQAPSAWEVYIRVTGSGANPTIVSKGSPGYLWSIVHTTDAIAFDVVGSVLTASYLWTATGVTDGQWHHIAINLASGAATCYLDGVSLGEQSASPSGSTDSSAALTGYNARAASDIIVDDLAYYNDRELTLAEIVSRAAVVTGIVGGQDNPPTPLLDDHATLHSLTSSADLTQLKNRLYAEGRGSTVPAVVPAGATSIPVEDATVFEGEATHIRIGDGRNILLDGSFEVLTPVGGARVGPGAAPETPLACFPVPGTDIDDGVHQYACTFVTAAGETLPGPLTTVTTQQAARAAPATNPAVAQTFVTSPGNGLTGDGLYRWAYTWLNFWDQTGETTLSPSTPVWENPSSSEPRGAYLSPQPLPLNWPHENNEAWYALKWYRTEAGPGATYKAVPGAVRTSPSSVFDNTPDAGLGAAAPGSNTATEGNVAIRGIPIGPSGTTQRKLYRTDAGGTQLKLLTTIADNTTTTYRDATADSGLGANAPVSDTSGLSQQTGVVVVGSTELELSGTTGFDEDGGWVRAGEQVLSYTGISGAELTGVPASGPGSIVAPLGYGVAVVALPILRGVTVAAQIPKGTPVYPVAQRDHEFSQEEYDVHEGVVQDHRQTLVNITAQADAQLRLAGIPGRELAWTARDSKVRPGAIISALLTPPQSIADTLRVETVTMSEVDENESVDVEAAEPMWVNAPSIKATAATQHYSLWEHLRLLGRKVEESE